MGVFLADDNANVRSALRLVLEQSAAVRVVGEAADACGLWAGLAALAPRVVLLDWELPGLDPADPLGPLRRGWPAARVVGLSARRGVELAAYRAGAHAFLSKLDPPEQVLATVRQLLG